MLSTVNTMHLDLGEFREKTVGNRFNWRLASKPLFGNEFPHEIYVGPYIPGRESETRFANVRKTVAYVVVDEAADGSPVVEKWSIVTKWSK